MFKSNPKNFQLFNSTPSLHIASSPYPTPSLQNSQPHSYLISCYFTLWACCISTYTYGLLDKRKTSGSSRKDLWPFKENYSTYWIGNTVLCGYHGETPSGAFRTQCFHSGLHMTLECRATKLWRVSRYSTMSLPWRAEPTQIMSTVSLPWTTKPSTNKVMKWVSLVSVKEAIETNSCKGNPKQTKRMAWPTLVKMQVSFCSIKMCFSNNNKLTRQLTLTPRLFFFFLLFLFSDFPSRLSDEKPQKDPAINGDSLLGTIDLFFFKNPIITGDLATA